MRSTTHRSYQKFLENLIRARRDAKLDQIDVAKKLRKDQGYVSRCETGARRMDVVEAAEFAKIYGMSLDELVGLSTKSK